MPYDPDSENDSFQLLLSMLSEKKDGAPISSVVNATTVDLMSKILSRDDYANFAARLDHASDAKNLLDFMPHMLHHPSLQLPTHDSLSRINMYAQRFMFEVMKKMHVLPGTDSVPHCLHSYILSLLLYMLDNLKKPDSTSVGGASESTVRGLVGYLLLRDDYISLATQLDHLSGIKKLLDFMPNILYSDDSISQDPVAISRKLRARRFTLELISTMRQLTSPNTPDYDDANNLSLLLYILNDKELLFVRELAVDLMDHILSRYDYLHVAMQLDNVADAKNVLDFIHQFYPLSSRDSNVDTNERANNFMLGIISWVHTLQPPNIPCDLFDGYIFPLLLLVIKPEYPFPAEFDNEIISGLFCRLLSSANYISFAEQVRNASEADNLLDFILRTSEYISRQSTDTLDLVQRATLFALVTSKTHILGGLSIIRDDGEAHPFRLLLYIFSRRETTEYTRQSLNPIIIELIRHILSREDYMDSVKLVHASDAIKLLDFVLGMLKFDIPFSDQDSSTMDMIINQRGRQFTLDVFSKTEVVSLSNMPGNPGTRALPFLLYVLNQERNYSLMSETMVDLLHDILLHGILCREDYVNLATQMDNALDARSVLDLLLDMLLNYDASSSELAAMNIPQRARRFMFKLISKIPVIPPSLIVTGVSIQVERNFIAGGGFGGVFKGKLQGTVVALKVLYKSDNQVAFCREALMWRSLKHKFVLPFLGIHEVEDPTAPQFFLVSPYMKNGTLSRWRKRENPSATEIEERILEVAQAMEYIHLEGAIHGDLRGENVLLDDNLHVQIADFGLTRISEATNTRSGALHLNFAAPELFGLSEDDESTSDDVPPRTRMTDVYAFGCLYYEIHYDSIPYAGKADFQILGLVSRGKFPPRLEEQPLRDKAWDLIQHCWVREPLKRPAMKDIAERMIAMSESASLLSSADDEVPQDGLSPSPVTPATIIASVSPPQPPRKRRRENYESDPGITSPPGVSPPATYQLPPAISEFGHKRRRTDLGGGRMSVDEDD